jgi:hypothetical protein
VRHAKTVTVAYACVLEFLLGKIASDAQLGGVNIRKPSFTNAEAPSPLALYL